MAQRYRSSTMNTSFRKDTPVIAQRGLHLDLKGVPPTFTRLMELLDLFAALRYTHIIVEWEDAFPWQVDPSFRSATAYSEDEIRQFVEKADRLGLELVPLVQTLGHMENFLKGEDRRSLLESEDSNDVLNPLAEGAQDLVQSMILDVLRLMPNVRHFHLGGDEAWHLGSHPQTKAFIEEHSAATLYLHHMNPLLDLLNQRGIRPMLWNDMMVKWDDDTLREMAGKCDVVTWGYTDHPDNLPYHCNSKNIARFAELGFSLWGGTAFKGADGSSADVPNVQNRLFNARAWVEVAQRHQFTGIITTGWSRYCYNACQCETLEAAIDILLAQALILHDGDCDHETISKAAEIIGVIWSQREGERFRQLHEAANNFAIEHTRGWEWVRTHHTHLAVVRDDGDRHFIPNNFKSFNYQLEFIRKTAAAYREALESLIPGRWLDRYFSERIGAIERLAITSKEAAAKG